MLGFWGRRWEVNLRLWVYMPVVVQRSEVECVFLRQQIFSELYLILLVIVLVWPEERMGDVKVWLDLTQREARIDVSWAFQVEWMSKMHVKLQSASFRDPCQINFTLFILTLINFDLLDLDLSIWWCLHTIFGPFVNLHSLYKTVDSLISCYFLDKLIDALALVTQIISHNLHAFINHLTNFLHASLVLQIILELLVDWYLFCVVNANSGYLWR